MNMEGLKNFFPKVFRLNHAFFHCLHTMGNADQVHPRQGPILGILLHDCGSSQADIVRKMEVSAATVAVSVSRLEKMGLVTRERNQMNQRANILKLTEKGREVATKMEKTMAEIGQAAISGFRSEELCIMENYCERMIQNLQQFSREKG